MIPLHLAENVVYKGDDLLLAAEMLPPLHCTQRMAEENLRLVDDQPFLQLVLIPEVEVEGALGHARLLHNVRDGRFCNALAGKKLEGSVQQAALLLLFVFRDLSHICSTCASFFCSPPPF